MYYQILTCKQSEITNTSLKIATYYDNRLVCIVCIIIT